MGHADPEQQAHGHPGGEVRDGHVQEEGVEEGSNVHGVQTEHGFAVQAGKPCRIGEEIQKGMVTLNAKRPQFCHRNVSVVAGRVVGGGEGVGGPVRRVGEHVFARVLARQLSERVDRSRLRDRSAPSHVQRRIRFGVVGVVARRGRAGQQERLAEQDAGDQAADEGRLQNRRYVNVNRLINLNIVPLVYTIKTRHEKPKQLIVSFL